MDYFSVLLLVLTFLAGAFAGVLVVEADFVAAGFFVETAFFAGDFVTVVFDSAALLAVLRGALFFGDPVSAVLLAADLAVLFAAALTTGGSKVGCFVLRLTETRLMGLSPQSSSSR